LLGFAVPEGILSYCLNPACLAPDRNALEQKFCSACGYELLLADRYRACQPIGQGGFGRTFMSIDSHKPSQPTCLIKQFYPLSPLYAVKAAELFAQEASRLEQLGRHPQIPELYAHFSQHRYQYIVQEFIAGANLANPSIPQLSVDQLPQLLLDLLPVLDFMQRGGVIHRDIKPENIICRPDGKLVLVDFGAAKHATATALGKTGTSIGSPEYSAPEQARGKATYASDIYGLGVTCLYMLTRTSPLDLFDIDEDRWIWREHLHTQLAERWAVILDRMIHNSLKYRYKNAAEVLADIQLPVVFATAVVNTTVASGQSISQTIQQAAPGSRILVEPGIYRDKIVIDKPIELIARGGVGEVCLENYTAACLQMQADYAVVRGFTIRNRCREWGYRANAIDILQGQLILEDCDVSADSLDCISIRGANTNPIIRRCRIHNAGEFGIFISEQGKALIENCEIFANTRAGLAIKQGANPTVRNCQIYNGYQSGIMVDKFGQGTIESCDIFGNHKSGIQIGEGAHLTARSCQVHDGACNGVYAHYLAQGTFENCDIFANSHDGVAVVDGSSVTIKNCRIDRNRHHGISVKNSGRGIIENCNLKANSLGAWEVAEGCRVQTKGNNE
jgi:parallel beta-helix repeat protein